MKKITLLLCTLTVTGLGFTSCSDDDSNSNNNNGIAGTYELREVNTQNDTDFDDDGIFHENQMEESDCYDGSSVTFHSDNTFSADMNSIIVHEEDGTSACTETTVNGTWEIYAGSGNNIILRATYLDDNEDTVVAQYTKQGDKLTRYNLFSEYPSRNNDGGAVYVNGDVEFVFEKQ